MGVFVLPQLPSPIWLNIYFKHYMYLPSGNIFTWEAWVFMEHFIIKSLYDCFVFSMHIRDSDWWGGGWNVDQRNYLDIKKGRNMTIGVVLVHVFCTLNVVKKGIKWRRLVKISISQKTPPSTLHRHTSDTAGAGKL